MLAAKHNRELRSGKQIRAQRSSQPHQQGAEVGQKQARSTRRGRMVCVEPPANKPGLDGGFVQAETS